MSVVPYIFFDGNCEEALRFYEKAAGATVGRIGRYRDAPGCEEGSGVPPEMANQVINATFTLGGTEIMASDGPPGHYAKPQGFSLALNLPDSASCERVFAALAEGGMITMPMAETFFAHRFGTLTDRFGIPWMVVAPKPM